MTSRVSRFAGIGVVAVASVAIAALLPAGEPATVEVVTPAAQVGVTTTTLGIPATAPVAAGEPPAAVVAPVAAAVVVPAPPVATTPTTVASSCTPGVGTVNDPVCAAADPRNHLASLPPGVDPAYAYVLWGAPCRSVRDGLFGSESSVSEARAWLRNVLGVTEAQIGAVLAAGPDGPRSLLCWYTL
jgi:hypothetical protein